MKSRQSFIVFRVLFGLYLAWYFLTLMPFMTELFSNHGIFKNRVPLPVPNVLELLHDPRQLHAMSVVLIVASLAIASGFQRRIAALVVLWGLISLRCWNALLCPPSDGYIGWLLLALSFIPQGEGFGFQKQIANWSIPRPILIAALIIFGATYTLSGVDKLRSNIWVSGDALTVVFSGPLARDYFVTELLRALPGAALKLLTWLSLGAEIFCAPLCALKLGRKVAWWAIFLMHFGVLFSVVITSVSLAMLLFNLFLIPIIFED